MRREERCDTEGCRKQRWGGFYACEKHAIEEWQKCHELEVAALNAAGWSPYGVPHRGSFAAEHEGSLMTVVDIRTEGPDGGFKSFRHDGDVMPPEGTWYDRTVYRATKGSWEYVFREENANH